MSDKNQNLIVLEEKVILLINRLKQNYLDMKNLSDDVLKDYLSKILPKSCMTAVSKYAGTASGTS